MTTSVYLAATETHVGKSAVALALIDAYQAKGKSVGVFKPLVRSGSDDAQIRGLLEVVDGQSYEDATGVTYEELGADIDAALSKIVAKHGALSKKYDAIVAIGSDFNDVNTPVEVGLNGRIAANLNSPVIAIIGGQDQTPEQVRRSAQLAISVLRGQHNHVVGLIAGRVAPESYDAVREALTGLDDSVLFAVLPESKLLAAATVRTQFAALNATLWRGDDSWLDRESLGTSVSGMTLPNLLGRVRPEYTQIVASDRLDLLPGLLLAQASDTFPPMAAVVLVGGYEVPDTISQLVDGIDLDVPIGATDLDSFTTATILANLEETMVSSSRKIDELRRTLPSYLDMDAFTEAIDHPRRQVRTQHRFEYEIMEQARADRVAVVLPESEDPRILEATSILLQRDVADIILLGDADSIHAQASELGFDVSGAKIQSMDDPELVERFSEEYAKLRAKKGVTIEQAKQKMTDPSYFGTMMVHLGLAKAMVSGATHTTANTIRPSLEFIKTKPGVSVVSGAFFMCMRDRVLLFADCAVNPNPTPEQLADIAISSADTAKAFGIEPRVAMLSYSTGTSGAGPDVDAVVEATKLVAERRPDLPLAGPIQFDAAFDATVGKLKMPDNPVAGAATVFIFPDLNTGNACYKAVQRSAGSVAVGPILQGLNKTVTDLSRGATVDDIVSTVAITAVQSQND